jgi:hypothetical protein
MPAGQSEFVEQVAKFGVNDFDYMFERNGLILDKSLWRLSVERIR